MQLGKRYIHGDFGCMNRVYEPVVILLFVSLLVLHGLDPFPGMPLVPRFNST